MRLEEIYRRKGRKSSRKWLYGEQFRNVLKKVFSSCARRQCCPHGEFKNRQMSSVKCFINSQNINIQ